MESGGRALSTAARMCGLQLGLRGILARHILFHWNRMGFTTRQQAVWANAAREPALGNQALAMGRSGVPASLPSQGPVSVRRSRTGPGSSGVHRVAVTACRPPLGKTHPSDPNRLDEDRGPDDGIACEVLPRRNAVSSTVSAVPTRGVQGGAGGSTDPAVFTRPLGVGLTMGALGVAVASVARRRRETVEHRRG